VLDLAGLASPEVTGLNGHPSPGIPALVREHNIDLAAIYREGMPALPTGWEEIGSICLPGDTVAAWKPCVQYIATNPAAAPSLRAAFASFIPTLPPGDTGTVVAAPNH
jgi:hypothetical protein